MKRQKVIKIDHPLMIMNIAEDDDLICQLFQQPGWDYVAYAIAVADLIRHFANACEVKESAFTKAVLSELSSPNRPTITGRKVGPRQA